MRLRFRNPYFLGSVEISIVEEAQPRLLLFDAGKLNYLELPSSITGRVLAGNLLKPEYAQRGIMLQRQIEPTTSYIYFNMDDPVVGGYTPEKMAHVARLPWATTARPLSVSCAADMPCLRPTVRFAANRLVNPGSSDRAH